MTLEAATSTPPDESISDAPPEKSARHYHFGDFELVTSPLELRREGERQELAPQPARLLELLVANAGRVVSREEIRKSLWGEDVHVDHERGINFNIRQIRAVLGDDSSRPRFIETVPRQGYRFVAPLSGEETVPARSRWPVVLAGLVLILGIVLGLGFTQLGFSGLGLSRSGAEGDQAPSPEASRAVPSAVAAEYEVARRLMGSRFPDDWRRAEKSFLEILATEPNLAVAHSGLGRVALDLGKLDLASTSAAKALELEGELPEAHLVLGRLAFDRDFDLDRAQEHFASISPRDEEYSQAQEQRYLLLVARGETEEAVVVAKELLASDPLSWRGRWAVAWTLFQDRQFEAAIQAARATAEVFPQRGSLPERLEIHSLIRVGRAAEAVEVARDFLAYHKWDPVPVDDLEDWWRLLLTRVGDGNDSYDAQFRSVAAIFHLGLGEVEEAIALLRESCEKRLVWDFRFLRTDPRFDALRQTPSFQEVLGCLEPKEARGGDWRGPLQRRIPL